MLSSIIEKTQPIKIGRNTKTDEHAAVDARELQATIDALFRIVSEQQSILTTMAHVARNPLALIVGPAKHLAEAEEEVEISSLRAQASLLRRNALKLQRLFDIALQQLHLVRLSVKTSKQQVDLAMAVQQEKIALQARADERGVDLSCILRTEAPVIYSDAEKVQQVIRHLITRAVEETALKGKVLVKVSRLGKHEPYAAEVRVMHTGGKETDKEQFSAFDNYLHLVSAIKEPVAFWHDLSLVRRLVGSLGGELSLFVEPSFSTEYVVQLPADFEAPVSLRFPEIEVDDYQLGSQEEDEFSEEELIDEGILKEKVDLPSVKEDEGDRAIILIIEDNADFRYYLRTCLEDRYEIVEAVHGKDGLEKAAQVVPDLIISDVMMPYVDGHALCRHIKQDKTLNHIPVILSTSLPAAEYRVQALEAEADAYLVKPFESKVLRAHVRSLLANRRRLRGYYSKKWLIAPTDITVPSVDEAFLETAQEVVEQKMADCTFDLGAFAEGMYMGPRQLQRKFKSVLGMTPMAFVRILRLKRAAQLLEQRAGNISQIAYRVGYNHARHFTRNFTRLYGKSPKEYMDEQQRD